MGQVTHPNAAPPRPGRWRLALLGEAVELTGPATTWHPSQTASLLLAYLALEGPTPRPRLAGLLWPDRPEGRARANLRQLLLRIRAVAAIVDGDPLALAPGVWVDARDLPPGPRAGPRSGRLLAAIDASTRPALSEWLTSRQQEHDQRLRHALQRDLAVAREERDLAAAAAIAERLSLLDPWSEVACRTVMEVALARGEPAAALVAFRRLRRELAGELGTAPGSDTVDLARRAARAAGAVDRQPPLAQRRHVRLAHRAESGGWLREGAELLQQMADGLAEGPELVRVLTELAWLEHRLGWNRRARRHARRGLAIAARDGDGRAGTDGAADAAFVLGSLAWAEGDLAGARDRWDAALQGLRRGDRSARLRLNLDLALVEDALERPAAARRHYGAALGLARDLGERTAEGKILNNLGAQLVREGRPGDGLALLRRAHALAREQRDRLLEGYVLDSIAAAYATASPAGGPHGEDRRDAGPAVARATAARAVAIGMESGDVRLQIEALLTLAGASLAAGDGRAARRFASAALARAEASGWQPLATAARQVLARAARAGGERDATVTADATP